MQVADEEGLRQITSEEEFASLVIQCGVNHRTTVSSKKIYIYIYIYIYTQINVSALITLYIINSVYYSIL